MLHQQDNQGINQIINLFTNKQKKKKQYNLTTIRRILMKVKTDGLQTAQQDLKQICCYINSLFLLNFLHTNLLTKQCYHCPADEKVITVIFIAYQIVFLKQFIMYCEKKSKLLKQLVQQLRQMINNLWINLQVMRISKSDIQNLFTLNALMQLPNQRQRYFQIVLCVYQNTQLVPTEIKRLFELYFLDILYRSLGSISNLQLKLSVKQKIQSLKLQIIYLRCIFKAPDKNKLKRETSKSKIYKIFDYQGFQTLIRYFNNLVIQDKNTDKRYCLSFFANNKMELIPEDQMENNQSEKIQIRIKPPHTD